VVAATGDRFGVNLISAVTARGKLRCIEIAGVVVSAGGWRGRPRSVSVLAASR
jgi:hypothetical protein